MNAFEQHLLLRKQLRQTTIYSRIIVAAIIVSVLAIDLWRVL